MCLFYLLFINKKRTRNNNYKHKLLHLPPTFNNLDKSTMAKITKEAALQYHAQGKPGKIEVIPTKPYSTQNDLSLA